jgi:hypothetical protein
MSRWVVLYRSDTEAFSVLNRRVAGGVPKRMGEVGLICIEIEMVLSKRLLHAQNLQQVMGRKAREPLQRSLQLASRAPKQHCHVGDRPDAVKIRQNASSEHVWTSEAMRDAPANLLSQNRRHFFEGEPCQSSSGFDQWQCTTVSTANVFMQNLVRIAVPDPRVKLHPGVVESSAKIQRRRLSVERGDTGNVGVRDVEQQVDARIGQRVILKVLGQCGQGFEFPKTVDNVRQIAARRSLFIADETSANRETINGWGIHEPSLQEGAQSNRYAATSEHKQNDS